MNYNDMMEKIIDNLDYTPRILLHSCCAPCSSAVIERLMPYFDITILYYNPNIEPYSEYEKRKKEQIDYLNKVKSPNKLDIIDADYDNEAYHKVVSGLEDEPERGPRCYKCYKMRLEYTAKKAHELNYDYFGTTLTLSPYKVTSWINEIGACLEKSIGVKFLVSDFKKKDGYKRSIELSKENNLYRQDYCGCVYSKKKGQME